MELDDLKEKWRSTKGIPSSDEIRKDVERLISEIRLSGRGIRKAFVLELVIALVMYLFFFAMVWVFDEKVMPYMYKLIGIVTLGTVPPVWRLYKVQRWINTMDFGKDVRSNMETFLQYFKKTLIIYKVSFYIVIGTAIAVMLIDKSFLELTLTIKLITIGYMIGTGLLIGPYIKFWYGGRTASIEAFLRD